MAEQLLQHMKRIHREPVEHPVQHRWVGRLEGNVTIAGENSSLSRRQSQAVAFATPDEEVAQRQQPIADRIGETGNVLCSEAVLPKLVDNRLFFKPTDMSGDLVFDSPMIGRPWDHQDQATGRVEQRIGELEESSGCILVQVLENHARYDEIGPSEVCHGQEVAVANFIGSV